MIIGIYTNIDKDKNANSAKELILALKKRNIEFCVCNNAKDYFDASIIVTFNQLVKKSTFIVAFGGDGTMLSLVSKLNGVEKPILGINLGKVGFLTEIKKEDLNTFVDKIISNEFSIEKRTIIEAKTNNGKYYSLNEILLSSSSTENISNISININNTYTTSIRGDGVMVATPTGSTAYSLSCNGPILSPSVQSFIVNTICPHSLRFVPMVVEDNSTIVLESHNKNMRLVVDGKIKETFNDENIKIIINKAKHNALFIRFDGQNFYQKLLQKLTYWGD